MADKENKASKLDMISSLKAGQAAGVEKKKEEEVADDEWNHYTDEEENDDKKVVPSMVQKDENKFKKFSNLKDILGDNKREGGYQGSNQNQKRKKNNYQGNYKDRDNDKGFSKPVFTNSSRPVNTEIDGIRNNNQEYSKRANNYNNSEKRQFYNSHREHREPREYREKNYRKPVDEKENVMKSISNFGNLVKNLNEENKNIKAPLKNYTDIDLGNENQKYFTEKPPKKEEIQRPTFINSSLNEKKNFKELDVQGDLYLKKLQEKGNLETNYQTEPTENRRSKKNYSKPNFDSEPVMDGEDVQEKSDYYKKKKPYKENYSNNFEEEDYWNLVNEEHTQVPKQQDNIKTKSKKVIRKESDSKKDDKVVISLGNAKSIKDIFG